MGLPARTEDGENEGGEMGLVLVTAIALLFLALATVVLNRKFIMILISMPGQPVKGQPDPSYLLTWIRHWLELVLKKEI